MTYTPQQESQLRTACHSLAGDDSPEFFDMYKKLLADEGIELKEPTEETKATGTVSRSIELDAETIRNWNDDDFIYFVGQEVAGALIRTVKYADLCNANGITLNAKKEEL